MVGTQDLIYEDKSLKLQLRLAQLEKNEACQKDFLTFVEDDKSMNCNYADAVLILKLIKDIDE